MSNRLLSWASDEHVKQQVARLSDNAKHCGKEGGDTRRKAGQSGAIHDELLRWWTEGKRRGIA